MVYKLLVSPCFPAHSHLASPFFALFYLKTCNKLERVLWRKDNLQRV